jgi:hypothetical protein
MLHRRWSGRRIKENVPLHVGISRAALVRMVATLLSEQDDEWQVADRRYFSAGSMARVDALEGDETPKELLAAIA